jgi:hypothetical protein
MSRHLLIVVGDKTTADTIQQGLASRKIQSNRLKKEQVVRFGMKIGSVEGSSQEFIEIAKATPDLADAIFDTIERVISRVSFYIDKKPVEIPNRQALKSQIVPPKTFEKLFGRK